MWYANQSQQGSDYNAEGSEYIVDDDNMSQGYTLETSPSATRWALVVSSWGYQEAGLGPFPTTLPPCLRLLGSACSETVRQQ